MIEDPQNFLLAEVRRFQVREHEFGLSHPDFGSPQMATIQLTVLKPLTSQVDTTVMNTTPAQYDVLARLMDASATRQRVIGANIANVNTPGYRRQDVDFEAQLAQLLEAGKHDKVKDIQPEITTPAGGPSREDGNNVDIDKEMGALSKNSVLFETYTQILTSKVGMMRSAISGRS